MQTRGSRKDVRGGVYLYLVQLNVNSEETQVTTKLASYPANEGIIKAVKERRLG